ncbi:DUF6035 family protein [Aeromonas veronii]|uniref:DUF6035 family protein n=1 Tax=Aeromonas veronii TaxID=654 RepID=UPI0012F6FB42|nr:DUF6035 family protein [Aeromonas veronii]QGW98060.1 hypothetical protein FGM04_16860 [Aeromonas veronii]
MKQSTIKEIFSPSDGKIYFVRDILERPQKELFEMRRKLRPRVGELAMLCSTCYQPVILAGRSDQSFYFRHIKDSDDCPIKTTSHLTFDEINAMKYNGQKEGPLHRINKLLIAKLLESDPTFSGVEVEKTFREENVTGIAKKWRRPDVSAINTKLGVRVAFELQVSTTFIDIIIAREEFYKNSAAFIIWIFLNFEENKFTELDIFYANKSNAFIFDNEAKNASSVADKLLLKCYYHEYYAEELQDTATVSVRAVDRLVSLDELTYNKDTGKIYFFDSDLSEKNAQNQVKIIKENKAKEKLLLENQKRETSKKEVTKNDFYSIYNEKSNSTKINQMKPRKGLSEKLYSEISTTKKFEKLRCEKCGNTDDFRNKACFIICNHCNEDVKY